MSRILKASLLGLLLASTGAARSDAGLLGTAPNYNGFIFGDANPTSDTEGRLAIKGNATLMNYGVGNSLPNGTTGDTLVVGGNLTFNSGQVGKGDIRVGGTANVSSFGLPNGRLYYGNPASSIPGWIASTKETNGGISPTFFSGAETYANNLSNTLAALSTTGTVSVNPYGYITLTGLSSAVNVFNITNLQLAGATNQGIKISAPAGSTVVLNIAPTVGNTIASMTNFGISLAGGIDKRHIVYNFNGITQINSTNIGILGSVLAPTANFKGTNGNIDGDLVVKSLTGNFELHNFEFLGDLDSVTRPSVAPVPEPGTLAGALIGLAGVGMMARRRRRAA